MSLETRERRVPRPYFKVGATAFIRRAVIMALLVVLAGFTFAVGYGSITVALLILAAFQPVGMALRYVAYRTVDGRSLGGGFVYPKFELRNGEIVRKELAECGSTRRLYGRLFVTNERLVHVSSRSWVVGKRGRPVSFELGTVHVLAVEDNSKREPLRLADADGKSADLWPFFGHSASEMAKRIQAISTQTAGRTVDWK